MRMRYSFAFTLLFTAMAGTGATVGTRTGPAETGACSLLSRMSVEEAFGLRFAEGEPRLAVDGVKACSFTAQHGPRVMVVIRRAPSADWERKQISRMNLGAYREVSGFGRRAYLYTSGGRNTVLCAFGDESYVQISWTGTESHAGNPEALFKIAQLLGLRRAPQ